jgi:solute carrier family 26 protein
LNHSLKYNFPKVLSKSDTIFFQSVLASVIVVALKSMVMQIGDVYKFWKLSKMDALVWLATFLTVVFVSIEIGLLTGVVMSLATIFVLSLKPHTCLLGSVPHTDLYMNIERYKGVSVAPKRVEEFVKGEIPGC